MHDNYWILHLVINKYQARKLVKGFHFSDIFTRMTIASAGISCHHVCLYAMRPSQVSVLLKQLNVGSRKQCHIPGTLVFWCQNSRQNSNRVTPNGGIKRKWGRLNGGAVVENWRLLTRSIVNLARLQVYHTEHPPYLFAAHSPWCSVSGMFVSDSWSLLLW